MTLIICAGKLTKMQFDRISVSITSASNCADCSMEEDERYFEFRPISNFSSYHFYSVSRFRFPKSFQSCSTSSYISRRLFIPRGKFNEEVFLDCRPVGLSKFEISLSFVLMTLLSQKVVESIEERRAACELV